MTELKASVYIKNYNVVNVDRYIGKSLFHIPRLLIMVLMWTEILQN